MKRFVLVFVLAGALVLPSSAQQTPSKTRATVEALASERFEGRLAGSNGERLAGDYIASDYPGTLEAAVRSGVGAGMKAVA